MHELPKRKELRIKEFDYSKKGAYFVTICIKERKRILSNIVNTSVGVGAHDDPKIQLTEIGRIVEKHLLGSERISGVSIDQYVIMPDHLHAIIFLDPEQKNCDLGESSTAKVPANQTLPRVISAFKRLCNKELGNHVFQRGYFEHVIRNREDYETRRKYMHENPVRWYYEQQENNG